MTKTLMQPKIEGFLTILDHDTKDVLLEKKNAINYENMSIVIARALSGSPEGHIFEIHFGNGGSTVSGTGSITYFPPNTAGVDADLYNPTYYKVVDNTSVLNVDSTRNSVTASHIQGNLYSDILVKCVIEYGEPSGQQAFDDAVNAEGDFVFDEIGLKAFDVDTSTGLLITHVVFSPIQKSLNRQIEIHYLLRISMC